ncbi:MAG: thioredoxin [Planctomycetaceae bacterium]|nr:thioredoxin [Planctomycetaceae bacterium]
MGRQLTTDDRRQTADSRRQDSATGRPPSAVFDDVQEANVVLQSSFVPRIVVGVVVVGFLLTILALTVPVADQPSEKKSQESDVVYLNEQTFKEQTTSGIVLVDFYADWCGPCQAMSPAIESVATRFKGKAVVAKVNCDMSPRLTQNFKVQSLPTLVLLKDGQEVFRTAGQQTEPELAALLETVLDQQL